MRHKFSSEVKGLFGKPKRTFGDNIRMDHKGLDIPGPCSVPVMGSSEHRNDLSPSMKDGVFLDWLSDSFPLC
jgi:hypothetical protein